jgi:16S rRNA (guanine527-N7)-methyltransferase
VNVSRETNERLAEFANLLLSWNRRINLVGARDRTQLQHRHIEDCLQIAELVGDERSPIADLGSGGGLPGLIISIRHPGLRVICIESDQRKAAFLREAIRVLDLDAEVRARRIEVVEPLAAPVVTARALAPLPRLLPLVFRHLAPDGAAVLMKGRRWQEELEKARATWHFSLEAASSRTDPQAVILSIGGLHRA